MLLHNTTREENGFMDRWEYVMWRAILASFKVTASPVTVTFRAPGEESEMLFYRLTGFRSAVQWLQRRHVVLPGIEDYPDENDYHS